LAERYGKEKKTASTTFWKATERPCSRVNLVKGVGDQRERRDGRSQRPGRKTRKVKNYKKRGRSG
jgi:hypothetical protein